MQCVRSAAAPASSKPAPRHPLHGCVRSRSSRIASLQRDGDAESSFARSVELPGGQWLLDEQRDTQFPVFGPSFIINRNAGDTNISESQPCHDIVPYTPQPLGLEASPKSKAKALAIFNSVPPQAYPVLHLKSPTADVEVTDYAIIDDDTPDASAAALLPVIPLLPPPALEGQQQPSAPELPVLDQTTTMPVIVSAASNSATPLPAQVSTCPGVYLCCTAKTF